MNNIYSFLGLARKAGKLISGSENCEKAVRNGTARLVVLTEDASGNTRKRFDDLCISREVVLRVFGMKKDLGHAIGKGDTAVVCITGNGFSDKIIEMLDSLVSENGGETYGKYGKQSSHIPTGERT